MGSSSGVQVIEGESFKINIFLTVTGEVSLKKSDFFNEINKSGTKFVLLTSLSDTTADVMLQRVYDIYADAVMKNPFHTPEMPIRSEGFDTRIGTLIGTGQT